MKVSISRSVGRAFAVMEHFQQTQEPATATQISRSLDAPHSSVVAVLHHLCELGYLGFDEPAMTYFPSPKLLDLTAWMRPAPREDAGLGTLVESVARATGHMTALSKRLSLFANTITVRPGKFSTVSAPAGAAGAALINSVYGHLILSQLEDDDVASIMRETQTWLCEAGARKFFDSATTLKNIDQARRDGFLAGGHPTCRGTEIIAYAVSGADEGAPFALSVHIPTCLSRDGKSDVRQMLETRLRNSKEERMFFFEKRRSPPGDNQKTFASSSARWG